MYDKKFDPLCELIQNALDSVEKRMQIKEEYIKFLAPNFSFKNGNTRGAEV